MFDNQKRLSELRSELRRNIDARQAILDKMSAEKRRRNADETSKWEALKKEASQLDEEIRDLEQLVQENRAKSVEVSAFDTPEIEGRDKRVFTYYKPTKPDSTVKDFVLRNYDNQTNAAMVSPGRLIRALLGGAKNDVETRALAETTNSLGGWTVPVITSAMILDNVRGKSYVLRSGTQIVLLDSNQQNIARLTADPAVAWLAENAAITASDPTFGAVQFSAKSLKATIQSSFEILQDSLNIEEAINTSLTGAFAAELDRVALQGAGTATEPRGIFNYTSPSVLSMGANGGSITSMDTLIDGIKVMLDNNCPMPDTLIMNPRTWQTLRKLKDTTNQYIQLPPDLAKLNFYESSRVSITQTQGTSNNASSIYMGGFQNLFYGQRLQTTIIPTQERLTTNAQYSFVAIARGDFAPYREGAFGLIKGII